MISNLENYEQRVNNLKNSFKKEQKVEEEFRFNPDKTIPLQNTKVRKRWVYKDERKTLEFMKEEVQQSPLQELIPIHAS